MRNVVIYLVLLFDLVDGDVKNCAGGKRIMQIIGMVPDVDFLADFLIM